MPFLFRLWLFLCSGALPLAAEFVPPAEGPVPFRRDKLPLDVDTMTGLSRQLMTFTGAGVADDPGELRALAQVTALALALDPANQEARDLIAKLKSGRAAELAEKQQLERAKNRAWQVMGWLEMPEAGADGQALAACLGDVLVVVDPDHPRSKRRTAGEQGAWTGWVAEELAFRPKEKEPVMEDPVTPPVEPEEETKALALGEVSGWMPLWSIDKLGLEKALEWVEVDLHAKVVEEKNAPLMMVAGVNNLKEYRTAFRRLEAAMEARHGTLPRGLQLEVDFGKPGYSVDLNGSALTGTAALLVDAAFSGKPPAASVLAVVGEDGKLELPPRLWQTLRAMSPLEPGRRLILPGNAVDFLKALVVMDDAAFFMKNEVLLAESVDELCELAAASPKEEIAAGFEQFSTIRSVGDGKALGSFVAHPSTQQRLRELALAMPEHASARMLALQGSGNRPRFLDRAVLAREIRSALEPAGYLTEVQMSMLAPERLETAHESCRERLDALAGYVDIRDRDLHKEAVAVADSLRTLARLLPEKDLLRRMAQLEKQTEVYNNARKEYVQLLRKLGTAAGDGADFPPPKTGGDN